VTDEQSRWRVRLDVTLPRDFFGGAYPASELEAIGAAIEFWEYHALRRHDESHLRRWQPGVEVTRRSYDPRDVPEWRWVDNWQSWIGDDERRRSREEHPA
jgi:hypothetical protein